MSKRRHNFGTKRFKEKSLFIFHARIALKSLILLFVRLIARGARIGKTHTQTDSSDTQTDRQNEYCNPRACAPRVNKYCNSRACASRVNNYYTAGMVQPKITTCTLGLATVVITLGNLASFPSYSCLVYMIL